jgi:hypothetical protein
MFTISPQWLLQRIGLEGAIDPETAEMAALLLMRFEAAPNKAVFVKETLRRALSVAPLGATVTPSSGAKLPRRRT